LSGAVYVVAGVVFVTATDVATGVMGALVVADKEEA